MTSIAAVSQWPAATPDGTCHATRSQAHATRRKSLVRTDTWRPHRPSEHGWQLRKKTSGTCAFHVDDASAHGASTSPNAADFQKAYCYQRLSGATHYNNPVP
jgi:hypothetical protein